MSLPLSRRNLLGLLGTTGAAMGLPTAVGFAREPRLRRCELADFRLLQRCPELLGELFDGRMPEAIGAEPVRAWRDGLGDRIAGSGAIALVRYDQSLLLRGLAREDGLQIHLRAMGGGAFHIAIEPRPDSSAMF